MELTPRQIYYKQYYKDNKDHIMAVVLKYQSDHKDEKKTYYTRYNREYFQKHKKEKPMKPAAIKIPRPEKPKKIPMELVTINGAPKQPREKKTQKLPEVATITEASKEAIKVTKVKPQFAVLRGAFNLSFD